MDWRTMEWRTMKYLPETDEYKVVNEYLPKINKMEWINVNEYLPGTKIDKNKIVVLLANGEIDLLKNRSILGDWETEQGRTYVKYWMDIEIPSDIWSK
jgi:hypothetical protein